MDSNQFKSSYVLDSEDIFALDNITFTDISCAQNINFEKTLAYVKEFSSTWNSSQIISQKSKSSLQSSLREYANCNEESNELHNRVRSNDSNIEIKCSINAQRRDIACWGLPPEIVYKYTKKGIKSMFQWQVECLGNSRVLNDYGNLVYSAPTSAGKTLVAEILSIKMVLERQKKVIIILPFVSVVREKTFYFQEIFNDSGIRVEGFMGSYSPPGGISSIHVAICTIEKANTLINRLLEDGTIADLGTVVVDELHLLGDSSRGYILELLLTKLLYVTKRYDHIQIQIIGMSATLPNLSLLSNWLDADLYKTDFRPVILEEQCHVGGNILNSNMELVRTIEACEEIVNDKDNIIHLCLETIIDKCSVLIFCPTKNWCENLAQQISTAFKSLGYSNSTKGCGLREQLDGGAIKEVLEQLRSSPVGLDHILCETMSFGVAFHHAGLTMDERDIIEGSFKRNIIRVLVATSTLSSGVNLPARRVIIRSPTFRSKPIDISSYKQMIGRAGRMGIDTAGESILMCTANDKKAAIQLMSGSIEPISSCLEGGDKLMRAILEAIASQVANTPADVKLFTECTLLLSSLSQDKSMEEYAVSTVKQLEEYELIRLQKIEDEMNYIATPLGKACLSSSMSPQDGLILFKELQKARECFVLETDLHMIYLVTPYSICTQWGDLNWLHLLNLWDGLSVAMRRVGEMIGIQESLIYRGVRGSIKVNTPALHNKLQILRRFYTALALQDLVNEVPLSVVANNYNCSRGMLQSLQQSAATFAGMVTAFSRQLGWKSFEILVSQFQDRLQFGIQSDLLDLMKLQSLNGLRARALFSSGIETVCQLASANLRLVENALHLAIPFQSEKEREGEVKYDVDKRNNMKNVWITGKKGVTTREAAEMLMAEARHYLQLEIGVTKINWKSEDKTERNKDIKNLTTQMNSVEAQSYNNLKDITKDFGSKTPKSAKETNESKLGKINGAVDEDLRLENHSTLNNNVSSPMMQNNSLDIVENKISKSSLKESVCASNNFTLHYSSEESMFDVSCELINTSNKETENKNKDLSLNKVDLQNDVGENDLSKSLSIFEDSFTVDTQLDGILNKQCSVNENINKTNCSNEFSDLFEDMINENQEINSSNDLSIIDDVFISSQETLVFKTPSKPNKNKRKNRENISRAYSPLKLRKLSKENISVKTDIKTAKQVDFSKRISKLHYDFLDFPISLIANSEKPEFNNKNELVVVDVCTSQETFKECCSYLLEFYTLSMSISVSYDKQLTEKIGSNLFGSSKNNSKIIKCKNQFHKHGKSLNGISFYNGNYLLFYFNFTSVNSSSPHLTEIVMFLKIFFSDKDRVIILNNCKKGYKDFIDLCGVKMVCSMEDPMVGDWLLNSDGDPKLLKDLADVYCNINLNEIKKKTDVISKIIQSSYSLCIDACITWYIMQSIKKLFTEEHFSILQTFVLEMKIVKILAVCELEGIGIDKNKAGQMLNLVKETQSTLEKITFKLTGRRFRFTSPSDVAKILGMYNGRKVSTSKKSLEKVENPVAQLVIYWRKLNNILIKTLFPLTAKAVQYTDEKRIYGLYWTHTSTGRISMQDPNLQSVPRNFDIPYRHENLNQSVHFNCRSMFPAADGMILISADYCQLELRLLAHLSKDLTLRRIVMSEGDIFKSIASTWKCISQKEVDDDLRQKAKQLCYGIIYGMGSKALGQMLDICELEATVFMNTFHAAYPQIKIYTKSVVEECRRSGYVETLSGRRRYIHSINNIRLSEKSHGERQAVNTTIQGSAADILKSAVIKIDDNLTKLSCDPSNIKLVLLLHDELMYEVPKTQLEDFKKILRHCMETTVTLSVPLPVKIKVGKTWGDMQSND